MKFEYYEKRALEWLGRDVPFYKDDEILIKVIATLVNIDLMNNLLRGKNIFKSPKIDK